MRLAPPSLPLALGMDISAVIEAAFPGSARLSLEWDDKIRENQNLMELPDSSELLAAVPAYMQWAVRNQDNYDQLVTDWTLNALAEYGRAKAETSEHMTFRFLCSEQKRLAVCAFLEWSLSALMVVHEEQVRRAIKHWC